MTGVGATARGDEARRLIEESARSLVELATLSAMELCALDGPRHLLFDEPVAATWGSLDPEARAAATTAATDGLVRRGLLSASGDPGAYAIRPGLGLVLAAKTRPTFAVLAQIEGTEARPMKMYAVGDEIQPLQAMVVELPEAAPPGDYPHVRRLGVLGRFYRHVLISPPAAADLLAAWALKPPPKKGTRVVSVYWHRAGEDLHGLVVTVRGDGRTARLGGYGESGQGYDETGLRQVMTDLFTVGQR